VIGVKILVVEDEPSLNQIIAKRLKIEGYSVDCAENGKEALSYVAAAEYDLLVVDIMMPEMDGLTLVKSLRRQGNKVPVLFLTARDSTEDKVIGLDSGGDDYLVKPFEFSELLARIRALLRRSAAVGTVSDELRIADLTLSGSSHEVRRGGKEIALTPKEFSILEYLLRNQGIVLSRDKILEHAWDFSYEGASNMVDVYIKTLRKKIDNDFEPKLLHTVRGAGYVLKE
jgi:two-component system copper resistance phosphate regulon response regulator CusR